MTDKLAPSLPAVLRQLVMKWRDQSAGKHVSGDDYYDGQRCGFARAAKELEAVIAALPSPQTWQMIETAPKDGTRIRLLTPFCDAGGRRCYEMFTGSWQTNDFGSFWEDEECAEESHPEYWRPLDDAPAVVSPRGKE